MKKFDIFSADSVRIMEETKKTYRPGHACLPTPKNRLFIAGEVS
jgi:hypothetical protein